MSDYQRLDREIDAARLDLGLSWVELAAQARVSDVSLRNFRKGRGNPSPLSKRRIEDVLGWGHGSIDAVLAGGELIPVQPAVEDLAARVRDLEAQLAEMQAALARLEEVEPDQEREISG